MNIPIIAGILILAVILLRTKKFQEVKSYWYFWSIVFGLAGLGSIISGLIHYNQALAFRVASESSDPQIVTSTVDLMVKLSIVLLSGGLVFLLVSVVGIFIGKKQKNAHDSI